MILHWQQLGLHYGDQINKHRGRFLAATQSTYGLLACRFSPQDDKITSSNGDHAERRLLNSQIWNRDVPAALGNDNVTSTITTTVLINRSPCRNCTKELCTAIGKMQMQFPLRAERNRFILASLGAYEPTDMSNATTQSDLVSLHNAGWELAVLQLGAELTARGKILQNGIQRVCGSGFVRLK